MDVFFSNSNSFLQTIPNCVVEKSFETGYSKLKIGGKICHLPPKQLKSDKLWVTTISFLNFDEKR